jgi:hypothetical protein
MLVNSPDRRQGFFYRTPLYLAGRKRGRRVSFREFSWFVGSFFVRGDFDRDGGQHETPVPGHGIIGVFALLALLIGRSSRGS